MTKLDELIERLCPDGVEYKTLTELFDTKNGYTPSKSKEEYWTNGTVPWFRMEDIRENGNILSKAIQYVSESAIKGSLFPADSIIVATSATIGQHALIKVPSLANQRFTYLVLKDEFKEQIDIMFIYYCCFKLDEYCKECLNQGNFASVDMKKFFKFKFPVPPLEVQREIVRILDNFTFLSAELAAELAARQKQYEYYRDLLLNFEDVHAGGTNAYSIPWLAEMLHELCPEGVEFKSILNICKNVVSGGTPNSTKSGYYDGDIPWLRTQEVNWTDILDTEIKITELGYNNSSAKLIPKNCVIIAMYGATAAKSAINKIPLTTNQACCNLEINEKIAEFKYVYYWFCKEYLNLKSLGQGSQHNINANIIKNYRIPVPPLAIQQRIVDILDRFDTLCNDISSGLPAEIEARQKQYEYYRDKLLTFKELKKEA